MICLQSKEYLPGFAIFFRPQKKLTQIVTGSLYNCIHSISNRIDILILVKIIVFQWLFKS
jgi:hypothetical protein